MNGLSIRFFFQSVKRNISRIRLYCRGSPLVEESILLGLSLFAFMILAAVVFNLVDFAKNIFDQITQGLNQFPT